MIERQVGFPEAAWSEIEALPQPLRQSAQRAIFSLLDEPVPSLAEPFPVDQPLPGAYRLHMPADGLTIWYVISHRDDTEIISIQHLRTDT